LYIVYFDSAKLGIIEGVQVTLLRNAVVLLGNKEETLL